MCHYINKIFFSSNSCIIIFRVISPYSTFAYHFPFHLKYSGLANTFKIMFLISNKITYSSREYFCQGFVKCSIER